MSNNPIRLGTSDSQEIITHKDGIKKSIGSSFYRGDNCNFNAYKSQHVTREFLDKYVMHGWAPETQLIAQTTKVTAFGSCFAANITKYLSARGFNLSRDRAPDIYISRMGEGIVNTHALLGQFAWAFEGTAPREPLWHGYDAQSFGYDEAIRKKTREIFLSTEFFVITLGLSEIWYDEISGDVFWRAVPMEYYDPSRHKFRVATFAETKQNIATIYRLIRKYVPEAKVLFTLSPVPLAATFRNVSCLTANSASKSILRAALDEMIRDHEDNLNKTLFYFPSYEIVNELFSDRFQEDGRHPYQEIIDSIMAIFDAYFCESDVTPEKASDALLTSRRNNAASSTFMRT